MGKAIQLARQATRLEYDRELHLVQMTVNIQLGCIDIRISSDKSFVERMELKLGDNVVDTTKDKCYRPWIRCYSDYVQEVARNIRKQDQILQLCFENQENLKAIPKGTPLKMKLTVIRFPQTRHKNGTRETFTIFFGLSTNPMYY